MVDIVPSQSNDTNESIVAYRLKNLENSVQTILESMERLLSNKGDFWMPTREVQLEFKSRDDKIDALNTRLNNTRNVVLAVMPVMVAIAGIVAALVK